MERIFDVQPLIAFARLVASRDHNEMPGAIGPSDARAHRESRTNAPAYDFEMQRARYNSSTGFSHDAQRASQIPLLIADR